MDVGGRVSHVEEVAERVVPDLVDDAHQGAGRINAVLVVTVCNGKKFMRAGQIREKSTVSCKKVSSIVLLDPNY